MDATETLAAKRAERKSEYDIFEEKLANSRLTESEFRHQVSDLRQKFEEYKVAWEAAQFDLFCGDAMTPEPIEQLDRPFMNEVVETLDPRLKMIHDAMHAMSARKKPLPIYLQNHIITLSWYSSEISYALGQLAGVIFAGCPKDVVDRFERSLVACLSLRYARSENDEG